ncbi:MAG: hypothetical protein FJY92_00305, partial [Candidatus Hydrogenedentes bacterium]|nr:hypothetical protein [Candidatus Hydrogenedentota bacterium]
MIYRVASSCLLVAITLFAAAPVASAAPVADTVYLQEVGVKVPAPAPIVSVAVADGTAYVAGRDAVYAVEGDALSPMDAPKGAVLKLEALNDVLYAIADSGLYRLDGRAWTQLAPGAFVDMCVHLGVAHAASANELFRIEGDALASIPNSKSRAPIQAIASYSGTLYVLHPGRLAVYDPYAGGYEREDNVQDWGQSLPPVTRDMLSLGSKLFVATDRGLAQLRGMALTTVRGADGLPYEDATCLAEGFGGDLWIGTSRGAIRNTGGEYHYFNA